MNLTSKKHVILAIVLAGLVVTSGLVLVVSSPAPASYDVSLVDALGRNVNLTKEPMKIISCAPEITEVLYAIGVGDRLVGVTDYCDYPADIVAKKEAGTVKAIGGFWDPRIEDIVNQTPDLVLVSGWNANHIALANQLDQMGIKAIAMYEGTTLDQVYRNVLLIGKALKMDGKAEGLVQGMQSTIDAVREKLDPSLPRERVLFVLWFEDPIYVAGNDTFISGVIDLAGGTNAVSVPGWATVSKEDIVASAPDVIFVSGTMALMTPDNILATLQSDPLWSMTDAVQEGRVYVLMNQGENVFVRQSVRIVQAVELMAEVLQPQQFGVTVPQVIGNEYESYLAALTPLSGLSAAAAMRPATGL